MKKLHPRKKVIEIVTNIIMYDKIIIIMSERGKLNNICRAHSLKRTYKIIQNNTKKYKKVKIQTRKTIKRTKPIIVN